MIYQGRVISKRSGARASPSCSRELWLVLQCTPQSLQNDCVRMLPAVLWRYRAWIDAGTEVGMEKICHRHDDSLSLPLMVCALEGGAVQTLGCNAEGGSGEGKSGRRPGTAFPVYTQHNVDAACAACHMHHHQHSEQRGGVRRMVFARGWQMI